MGGLGGIWGSGGLTPRRSERASGGDLEPERFRCGWGPKPLCASPQCPLWLLHGPCPSLVLPVPLVLGPGAPPLPSPASQILCCFPGCCPSLRPGHCPCFPAPWLLPSGNTDLPGLLGTAPKLFSQWPCRPSHVRSWSTGILEPPVLLLWTLSPSLACTQCRWGIRVHPSDGPVVLSVLERRGQGCCGTDVSLTPLESDGMVTGVCGGLVGARRGLPSPWGVCRTHLS